MERSAWNGTFAYILISTEEWFDYIQHPAELVRDALTGNCSRALENTWIVKQHWKAEITSILVVHDEFVLCEDLLHTFVTIFRKVDSGVNCKPQDINFPLRRESVVDNWLPSKKTEAGKQSPLCRMKKEASKLSYFVDSLNSRNKSTRNHIRNKFISNKSRNRHIQLQRWQIYNVKSKI